MSGLNAVRTMKYTDSFTMNQKVREARNSIKEELIKIERVSRNLRGLNIHKLARSISEMEMNLQKLKMIERTARKKNLGESRSNVKKTQDAIELTVTKMTNELQNAYGDISFDKNQDAESHLNQAIKACDALKAYINNLKRLVR